MLIDKNSEQYKYQSKYINTGLQDTYFYMIGHAACLPDYTCHPNSPPNAGDKKDFQYWDDEGKKYAFIANQNSILFYFVRPDADFSLIKETFGEANKNNKGEITIRIQTTADAKRVLEFVFRTT